MKKLSVIISILVLFVIGGCAQKQQKAIELPVPKVITAGAECGQAPSDAIVLFDGTNFSQWMSGDWKSEPKWKMENGYFEVVPKTGSIYTRKPFGSCQLHIEWASPVDVNGTNQNRGNSGIFLMNQYEIQVLDNYENATYPDGQAGSVYSQNPPMVNVCKKPGEWQSYDIVFTRPVFKGKKCVKNATVTVFQNGVIVQNNFVIKGTTYKKPSYYQAHADKEPIQLQDHSCKVRYRNIWIRELAD